MKRILSRAPLVLIGLLASSCSRQPTQTPVVAQTQTPPQVIFDTAPSIQNNHLKVKMSYRKLRNQHLVYTVGLQTLSAHSTPQVRNEYSIGDVDTIIAQGYFSPVSEAATLATAGSNTFSEDLNKLRFDKQNTGSVRLKVTLVQAATDPKTWQKSDAIIVFSNWLPYKKQ